LVHFLSAIFFFQLVLKKNPFVLIEGFKVEYKSIYHMLTPSAVENPGDGILDTLGYLNVCAAISVAGVRSWAPVI
jgi:hypothetical protein